MTIKPAHNPDEARSAKPATWSWPGFWLTAWLATALAGGVFGMVLSFPSDAEEVLAGSIFGTVIAAIIAVPVVATFFVITRILWLSRFAVAMAGASGACTGILSTVILGSEGSFGIRSIVLAGFIGGITTSCITSV